MNNIEFQGSQVRLDIFALTKLYKGPKDKASELNESLRNNFNPSQMLGEGDALKALEEGDIMEVFESVEILSVFEEVSALESTTIELAATEVLGAGISFAIYKALKEILSLEGARRRGELDNAEVLEQVIKVAWSAGKKGVVISAVLGGIITVFGSWIVMPLAMLTPFVGVQMVGSLWQAFWNGLDKTQKQELRDMANQLGGKVKRFFSDLDRDSSTVASEGSEARL